MEQGNKTVNTQKEQGVSTKQTNAAGTSKIAVPPKAPPKLPPKAPAKPQPVKPSSETKPQTLEPKKQDKPVDEKLTAKDTKAKTETTENKKVSSKATDTKKPEENAKKEQEKQSAMPKRIKKPNEVFYKTISIIGNVLFIPFFLIILFSTILMFSAKVRNEVPSLFGYSAVKILSPSMEDGDEENGEFYAGDVVLVKVCNPEDLQVDNIIAFYEPIIKPDDDDLTEVTSGSGTSGNIETTLPSFMGGGVNNEYQSEAAKNYSIVKFHRIVKIYENTNPTSEYYGKIFFETQGDRNNSPDTDKVMADYVVGVYVNTNSFVGNLFQFCTTTAGMIVLILLPSLIIIALLVVEIYGQARKIKYEKQFEAVASQEQILKEVTNEQSVVQNEKKDKKLEKKREDILQEILSEADAKADKSKTPETKVDTKSQPQKPNVSDKPSSDAKSQPQKPEIKTEPKKSDIKTPPKKPDVK